MSDGKQRPLKVFISSTYIDLKNYRQVAIEVAERYKCAPLAMELFGSQPDEPTKVAKTKVQECDIFVGIYAHRYGFIPEGQQKSTIHQEYELAKKLKKYCLCFVLDPNFSWNPKLVEPEKYERLKSFLNNVKRENVVSFFATTSDFEAKLSSSLGKILLERQTAVTAGDEYSPGKEMLAERQTGSDAAFEPEGGSREVPEPETRDRAGFQIPPRCISDMPAKVDLLGFSDYVKGLKDFIAGDSTEKPITIGIDAAWGMGKTTLMGMIKDELDAETKVGRWGIRFHTIWFNAWKYDKEESLWAALALELLAQLKKQLSAWQKLQFWAKLSWKRCDRRAVGQVVLKIGAYVAAVGLLGLTLFCIASLWLEANVLAQYAKVYGMVGMLGAIAASGKEIYDRLGRPLDVKISKYIREPKYKERVGFIAEFETDFRHIVEITTKGGKYPLVVFIDDLDRCAPSKPVEIIEAINILSDAKHCIFLLGIDARSVAASIESKYKPLKEHLGDQNEGTAGTLGQHFLEKIIQINFRIPRTEPNAMLGYISAKLTPLQGTTIDVMDHRASEQQREGQGPTKEGQGTSGTGLEVPEQFTERRDGPARLFDRDEAVQRWVWEAASFLDYNPRKVTRFINLFRLLALIANRRHLLEKADFRLDLLAKWVVVTSKWPGVVQPILSDPNYISRLIEARQIGDRLNRFEYNPEEEKDLRSRFDTYLKDTRIKHYIDEVDLVSLLGEFSGVGRDTLSYYLHLGQITASSSQRDEVRKAGTEGETRTRRAKIVPVAPTPYIAHSYALPPNFTGREVEKAMLSNWLHNAKEPMLVLEAIGGMGKTALSWVWLHDDVLERKAELDGVFWWSFYEEPFETFLEYLYHYVTSREMKVEEEAVRMGVMATLNSILHNNRFLLILDGFERALRGYASMSAMYIQEKGFSGVKEAGEDDWGRRQRQCVHPYAGKFLKALASTETKTLMTTRLFPTVLQEISGVQHEQLKGLSREDAVRFLRSEGIEGTRAQMERAGEIYDFHPLMLKQLSSAIKRKRKKDIESAFELNLIDQKEPQKILNRSFELLSVDEKKVATAVSVFRSSFDFVTAKALFPEMDENALWEVLSGLQQLGFIFYDEKEKRFDFHPIMRSFLYDNLTTKDEVHERAAEYFQKIPPTKIVKLEDLNPVIELYHHLVEAGKMDEAFALLRDRFADIIYYQLSAYNLYNQLLRELFVDGEERPPRLKSESAQAWTLAALANSYSLSGEPNKAMPLILRAAKISESANDTRNIAIDLGNAANMAQVQIGKVSAADVHLRNSVAICQEIKDEFEAIGHQELGRVLVYQGQAEAKDELANASRLFEKLHVVQWLSVVSAYHSLGVLLQGRLAEASGGKQKACELSLEALQEAHRALEFVEKWAKKEYPMPRDFVRAYWLLGEALVLRTRDGARVENELKIRFYDEYFQEQKEEFIVKVGSELEAAERCLTEALRRCRAVNLVEMEADILLSSSELEWVKTPAIDREVGKLGQINQTLKEAHQIAERSGYRLQLADIHLFCGEILIETGQERLLGLSAKEHIEKAKEYAKDVSTFDDLYKSRNPHFYDGIEGYEMLKRGMTEKERIENGYFVAYQIAEALEKKLK